MAVGFIRRRAYYDRGTTLQPARLAHTAGTGSSDKPLPDPPPPYDRGQQPSARVCQSSGQSWPFLDRCHPAPGGAAGPGEAPEIEARTNGLERNKASLVALLLVRAGRAGLNGN